MKRLSIGDLWVLARKRFAAFIKTEGWSGLFRIVGLLTTGLAIAWVVIMASLDLESIANDQVARAVLVILLVLVATLVALWSGRFELAIPMAVLYALFGFSALGRFVVAPVLGYSIDYKPATVAVTQIAAVFEALQVFFLVAAWIWYDRTNVTARRNRKRRGKK